MQHWFDQLQQRERESYHESSPLDHSILETEILSDETNHSKRGQRRNYSMIEKSLEDYYNILMLSVMLLTVMSELCIFRVLLLIVFTCSRIFRLT